MSHRPLLVLSIYQLLSNNRSSLFTVYFVLYVVKYDDATIATGLTAFSLAYVSASLISPLAGRLSDRLGQRKSLLLFAEVASLPFFISIPFVHGFLIVSLFFLLAETILSFGQTALQAFVADITSSEQRGRGYGFVNAVGSAGAVGGILAAGIVAQAFGLGAIFYMVGLLMIGTVFLVIFAVPDKRIAQVERRKTLREMKGVAVFSVATSIRTLGTGAVTAFFGTYAAILGANNFEVSLVAIAGLGTTALLGTSLGRTVDSFGEIRSYLLGTTVVIFSLIIYALASIWFVLVPARIVYAAGFALLSPAMLSWVTKIAPENRKAEYLGFFAMINSTLWSFGPVPGGIMEASFGPWGLFLFAISATMASIVSVYLIYSRARTERRQARAVGPEREQEEIH
jgi:DHA1 family multidrug resistance protein-like MFS transporter